MKTTPPPVFTAVTVGDLMTPNPVALLPGATVGEAMELMDQRRFRHVPVVDDDGMVVGIISQRDILRLAWPTQERRSFDKLTSSALVGDVMVREPDTIEAGAPVAIAARYMLRSKRDSLPVVGPGGHLVGILTAADFLREVVRNAPSEQD